MKYACVALILRAPGFFVSFQITQWANSTVHVHESAISLRTVSDHSYLRSDVNFDIIITIEPLLLVSIKEKSYDYLKRKVHARLNSSPKTSKRFNILRLGMVIGST